MLMKESGSFEMNAFSLHEKEDTVGGLQIIVARVVTYVDLISCQYLLVLVFTGSPVDAINLNFL